MVENFGGSILYLILFLIHLFFIFSTFFEKNEKKRSLPAVRKKAIKKWFRKNPKRVVRTKTKKNGFSLFFTLSE